MHGVCLACFWLGHWVSWIQELDDGKWFDFWFPAYSWLMITSHDIDKRYEFGEWIDA